MVRQAMTSKLKTLLSFEHACSCLTAVIPAKAEALFNSESWSIQVALMQKAKMDSRFRGNDGSEGWSHRVAGSAT